MRRWLSARALFGAALAAAVALVSACTTTPPPPPPPPPAPKFVSRPYPPMGAAPNLVIPPTGADGTRLTINTGLTPRQAVWNLRSAFNVAALNCTASRYAPIVDEYGDFLETHKRSLGNINRALDEGFKAKHGKRYIAEREALQTQVYNYFALPPVIPSLCDTTLALTEELRSISPGQLEALAPASLAKFEAVYLDFFDRYDRYRREFAQWQIDFEAKYGVPPADGYFLPGEPRYRPQTVAEHTGTQSTAAVQ